MSRERGNARWSRDKIVEMIHLPRSVTIPAAKHPSDRAQCSAMRQMPLLQCAWICLLFVANDGGTMFPQLRGRLLLSLHGYRSTGARIVAIDVDSSGVPRGTGPEAHVEVLTPGWDFKAGVRPMGAPVGLAVAGDGAIWLADDRNAAILRIAAE
jgi:glucose/arabinose dehydrogenase